MTTTTKLGLSTLMLLITLFSCKKSTDSVEENNSASSNLAENSIVSSTAAKHQESEKKFIRTADIKFKVKDVAQSTYFIEDVTQKLGGYVTFTKLESTITNQNSSKISQDSTLLTTKYTIDNTITIRIPNTQLDTLLKSIAKQIDFLEVRTIKAEDITLDLVSNQLAKNRLSTTEKRIKKAIDTKATKRNDMITAETTLDSTKKQSDQQLVDKLKMEDQINFSTISLYLHQNESVKHEVLLTAKDVNEFKPHLGIQILDAGLTGWNLLKTLFLLIIKIWPLLLIALAVYVFFQKKKKNHLKP